MIESLKQMDISTRFILSTVNRAAVKKPVLILPLLGRKKMTKADYLVFLMEEISTLEKRFQPQATGHLRTTVSVLRKRVEEVKKEINGVS